MKHIAVVEDDSAASQQIQNYLSLYQKENGQEFSVTAFSDGLSILEDYHPIWDIILMDIEMPLMDGMTTAKRIRELDQSVIIIFIYTSEPINVVSGTTTYTGSYLDVMQAAYGEYQARVVAFPAIGDTASSMSAPAAVDFIAKGEQSLPTLAYFWDSFSDTMNFQLSNVGAYTYEAYPKEIEVTCTNVNDASDVVTATLEDVSPDNVNFSAALTKGETYTVTARAVSDSEYVTNTVSDDTAVAEDMTVGELNILSPAYSYSHGSVNFPLITEGFNLANGGSAGDLNGRISNYSYDCTPTAATPGSAYSYDVSIYYVDQGDGKLELHEDGTATLSHGQWAFVRAAHIDGVWIDNGDGTATLNFDNSSVAAD